MYAWHMGMCLCVCMCITRVNVNVGRVTRRMNPALIHVVVNVRVWVLVCNSNKNLKTLLRKKKSLRREQRWAERGRRLGIRVRTEEGAGWLVGLRELEQER